VSGSPPEPRQPRPRALNRSQPRRDQPSTDFKIGFCSPFAPHVSTNKRIARYP
jgi:hypothetical protein